MSLGHVDRLGFIVPMRHPAEFWRKVLDLVEAGRPIAEIVEKLGVSSQTIYDWRNQDLVDSGLSPGVTTTESVKLAATWPSRCGVKRSSR